MTAQEIVQIIKEVFPAALTAALPEDKHPRIELDGAHWPDVARFLHDDPRLQLDWLANLTAIDYVAANKLAIVYDLWSLDLHHSIAAKVFIPRDDAKVVSVCDLWPAANWHEREAFDLLGIQFLNHPNLTRILCAEDWVGYPLRKDYVYPKEFHGIPGDPGMPWDPTNKPKPPAATAAAAKK